MNRFHKIFIGFLLRCPNCEKGKMFSDMFTLREKCPVCEARFERIDGESLGGMMINLGLAELLSIGGFLISQALFAPSLAFQLIFWGVFNILFVVIFYRHARGMWIAISYLTGGVYPDPKPDAEGAPPAKT